MRQWWWLCLSALLALAPGATGATGALDTTAYVTCVTALEKTSARYQTFIPASLFALDRKLARMAEGISILRENLGLIIERSSVKALGPADRLLLGNATEGCETYRATFGQSASLYSGLLSCVILLFLCLLTSTFFGIGQRPSPPSAAQPLQEAPTRVAKG